MSGGLTDAGLDPPSRGRSRAAIARQLAPSGARILILERGEPILDEPERSDPEAVFVHQRYRTTERWQGASG